jgi:hypothetical protein
MQGRGFFAGRVGNTLISVARYSSNKHLIIMADQLIAKKLTAVKSTLAVTLRPSVTKDQINQILERIYKESGCLACGLGGRDLYLNIDEILHDGDRFRKALDFDAVVNVKILNSFDHTQQLG